MLMKLRQVMENLDQSRNRSYVLEVVEYIQKKMKTKTGEKDKIKHRWTPARVMLFEATLISLASRREALNDLEILTSSDLTTMTTTFEASLLSQLHKSLRKGKKLTENEKRLAIVPTINALTAIKVDKTKLALLADDATAFLSTINEMEHDVGMRLAVLFSGTPQDGGQIMDLQTSGDTLSIAGRQSILAIAQTQIDGKDQDDKLELLETICKAPFATVAGLHRLLATKYIISACAGL